MAIKKQKAAKRERNKSEANTRKLLNDAIMVEYDFLYSYWIDIQLLEVVVHDKIFGLISRYQVQLVLTGTRSTGLAALTNPQEDEDFTFFLDTQIVETHQEDAVLAGLKFASFLVDVETSVAKTYLVYDSDGNIVEELQHDDLEIEKGGRISYDMYDANPFSQDT